MCGSIERHFQRSVNTLNCHTFFYLNLKAHNLYLFACCVLPVAEPEKPRERFTPDKSLEDRTYNVTLSDMYHGIFRNIIECLVNTE